MVSKQEPPRKFVEAKRRGHVLMAITLLAASVRAADEKSLNARSSTGLKPT